MIHCQFSRLAACLGGGCEVPIDTVDEVLDLDLKSATRDCSLLPLLLLYLGSEITSWFNREADCSS